MKNSLSLKPTRRAERRAHTKRVVNARFKELRMFETIFKDPLTGTYRLPLPAPGKLASEGHYGGCSKASMCSCCHSPKPLKQRLQAQTVREELKQL